MQPTFMIDESFTVGMIGHGYKSILELTALDVHPPLYYVALKTYLGIFTFWTSNMFIKVFFARIFSVICSIITFHYLYRLVSYLGFKYNKYILWLFFLLMPTVLGNSEQFTNIRMYAFSMMLIAIEVYYLVMYIYFRPSKKYFTIFTLSAILSFYTNYFSAIVAGTYLFIFFIDCIIERKSRKAVNVFISGCIFLLCAIPYVPVVLKQLSLAHGGRMWVMDIDKYIISLLKYSKFIIIFIIPFILLYSKLDKVFKKLYFYSFIVLLVNMFLLIKGLIVMHYLAPSYFIFIFLSINLCIFFYKQTQNKKYNFILIIPLFILISSFGKSFYQQVTNYDIPSIKFISEFNKWEKSDKDTLKTNFINYKTWGEERDQNAIYLQSINKRISNKYYMNSYDYLGNGNDKLFRSIFWNVDHYYKKK
ncbi:glycosyltransferase family 39 protein [Apilactobacillus timberlakei]|nr:glycosyltransferase family 39 protein [Apilactobacillus timberlakei]